MREFKKRCGTCSDFGGGTMEIRGGRYVITNHCNAPDTNFYTDSDGNVLQPPSGEAVDKYGYCGAWRPRFPKTPSFPPVDPSP